MNSLHSHCSPVLFLEFIKKTKKQKNLRVFWLSKVSEGGKASSCDCETVELSPRPRAGQPDRPRDARGERGRTRPAVAGLAAWRCRRLAGRERHGRPDGGVQDRTGGEVTRRDGMVMEEGQVGGAAPNYQRHLARLWPIDPPCPRRRWGP